MRLAWTSLGISIVALLFTVWQGVASYRRAHLPRLSIYARGVSMSTPEDFLAPGLLVRVVNTGSRPVEVAQMHTQTKGAGVRWLAEARGLLNLKLEPGQSKEWAEPLQQHFDWMREHRGHGNFVKIRAIATTSDNRTFYTRYLHEHNPTAGMAGIRWTRLKWSNRWRRLRRAFSRAPEVLN